ncbi:MAG TPA: FxSxx-COOH system tetratricopeptide repeat protein, partial [Ktedonobacteraceae bacterium]|nr:FxSxx-COOH system tetratricopeptide repeat protein [Ktedonobacteraceae bacterium]
HIISQLRRERIARNLRQLDLAEQLGTTIGTIKRWERGSQQPSLYFRVKLCALFGKSAEELGLLPGESPIPAPASPVATYWSLPFPRNPFFTGREELLEQLHTLLTQEPTRAALTQAYGVHGLGGIGKTQLAIEYAYRHRHEYQAVLWVQAQDQASLMVSFGRIAAALTLPERTEDDHNQIVAAVLAWLNRQTEWLLIFDNVEELSLIKPFLPASNQGAILLTTRLQGLGSLARPIELPLLNRDEGCAFLLARTHYADHHTPDYLIDSTQQLAAQAIATQMDGLPLALEQAGAYIEATGCHLSEYLQLFEQRQYRLLEEHEPSSDHPHSVSRTFSLAFQQVEQRHPLAADLLMICAFLAPEAIPEQFFLQCAPLLGPTFASLQVDPLTLDSALRVLRSYSLLQRQASTRTLHMHRLVQIVLRGRLTEQEQFTWAQRVLIAMEHLFPAEAETQADYLSLGEQLLPHAQICLSLVESCHENQARRVSLMNHVAAYLYKQALYGEAEPLFGSAIHLAEQTLGENHPLLAEALHGLADLSLEQGKYAQAAFLCERALSIRQQALPPQHPQIATSLNLLGALSNVQGNYAQAEQYYQQALHIREQALAPEHAQIASSLLSLGRLYRGQLKYEQAEPLFQRAVLIWGKALGPEHPQVANVLNNLGNLYYQQGKYAQAEHHYQRALRIREHVMGPEHPLVATALNNLGAIVNEQGNYAQAEPYFQRALHIRERVLGPEHPHVGTVLNNLGNVYYEQGDYARAERCYQRVQFIWERALGPEHPDLATSLTNLGNIYAQKGNYTRAERCYQRAQLLWERTMGPEHPDLAYIFSGLANVAREQGRYEQAWQLYHRTLMLRQQHLDPEHPELANTLYELAQLHHLQRRHTAALSCYQCALTIRQQVYGPDHPRTRQTRDALTRLAQEMMPGKETDADQALNETPENILVCACGCGRPIDRSKSHGEPRRFFSAACRQRVYRHGLRHKRHAPSGKGSLSSP